MHPIWLENVFVQDRNDQEADVSAGGRPEQTDRILGHDQERDLHTNRQWKYPFIYCSTVSHQDFPGFFPLPVVKLYLWYLLWSLNIFSPDLSLIQQEVDALEELSRQLFLETVDLQATKVKPLAICAFSL